MVGVLCQILSRLSRSFRKFSDVLRRSHSESIDDAAFGHVVWAHLKSHTIAREDLDEELAHLSADIGEDDLIVLQTHFEARVWQCFGDLSIKCDFVFLGQMESDLSNGVAGQMCW